jgi:hypothetical protein
MTDHKKFEWHGRCGKTRFKVMGSTDDKYVRKLITHAQESIATAATANEKRPLDFMDFLQQLPNATRAGVGDEEAQCPAERVMGIITTLGRNDWKIDIVANDEEECWVVTAQHPLHGITESKHPELITALTQTGAELRQFVKPADS